MQRDEVLSILAQYQDSLKHFRIKSLAIFGSVARDEARPNSDIDFLVEFEQPVSFDQYIELKFYLEDHLGTQVDLVSRRSLKPQICSAVEREAISVT